MDVQFRILKPLHMYLGVEQISKWMVDGELDFPLSEREVTDKQGQRLQ